MQLVGGGTMKGPAEKQKSSIIAMRRIVARTITRLGGGSFLFLIIDRISNNSSATHCVDIYSESS